MFGRRGRGYVREVGSSFVRCAGVGSCEEVEVELGWGGEVWAFVDGGCD